MKNLIVLLALFIIFIFVSCSKDDDTKTVRPKKEKQTTEQETTNEGSSQKEENLTSKESELKQKELELKEKELQLEEEKMKMERDRNTAPPPPQNKKRYGSVPGDFPEGSTRYISYNDIAGLSKWQLSVMRNEIYARHGYIFTQNMSIKNHFERQSWYVPMYYNVDGFLTKIEKYNVNFIKQYE